MHPSPDQSWSLPEHPGLYADEAGTTITNEAGFEIGWDDQEPFVVEGYGIALWGENPGDPPKGQDEVMRVLKQLGCTIQEDRLHEYGEDEKFPECRGRQCRSLEVRLPVNMTEKQGQRFRNALDRWDREFEANIDYGDVA